MLLILKVGLLLFTRNLLSNYNDVQCAFMSEPFDFQELKIVQFLSSIILKEFEKSPQNFLIKYKGTTAKSHQRLAEMVDKILQRIEGVTVHVGQNSIGNRKYKLEARLWFVDSVEAFRDLNEAGILSYYQLKYKIVYIPTSYNYEVNYSRKFMHSIFKHSINEYLINMNVCYVEEDDEISVYTFFPFEPENCKSTVPHLIYAYKNNTSAPKWSELFPTKYANLNGCSLAVAIGDNPPYTTIDVKKNGLESISGFEGELLKLIAVKANFSINIVTTDFDMSSTVYDNGTATGIYKTLLDKRANVSLGDSSCSVERMKIFSATQPYFQSSIYVVLKSGEPYSPIEVLFYPFSTNTWLLFITMCSMRFFWIKLLWRFLRKLPRSFQQFMLAMWLISVMYFRSGYEGKFINYMQNRPLKPWPQTFDGMLDENYVFIADFVTINVFKYWNFVPDYIVVVHHTNAEESFDLLLKSGRKIGLFTKEEFFSLYLKKNPDKHHKLVLQKENIISDIICMYLPSQSYLVDMFNDLYLRLRSAGFVEKLSKDFATIDNRSSEKHHHKALNGFQPLNVINFQGVFFLFLCCWGLCLVVFIIENLSLKYESLSRFIFIFQSNLKDIRTNK